MSEINEKARALKELPIFPLPLVLVPNELLPLHIFEDRYRRMISDIGQKGGMFGINHFESEEEFLDRPQVGSIGCVAEITEFETMSDGRSNLISFGVVRYRILEYVDRGAPYLFAEIGVFEDEPEDPASLDMRADDVFATFERIARAAFKMSSGRRRFPEIQKTDPQTFSFLATAALNLENEVKYRLLAMTSTSERLKYLHKILLRNVDMVEENADILTASKTNGHSKKKLDI
jgi:Lon protease-like protein